MRLCRQCGGEIVGRRRDAIYCSKRCAHRACIQSHPESQTRRKCCPNCVTVFEDTTPNNNMKYCSARCRRQVAYRRWSKNRGARRDRMMRSCEVCGLVFRSKRYHQKYCCLACRAYALNRRRTDKNRKTKQPPRVSPELVARRAAAVRQRWDEQTRLKRAVVPTSGPPSQDR